MRIFSLFTEHPEKVGETYLTHALMASKIALKFAIAAPMQLLHAIFPFIKPPFDSDSKSMRSFLRKMNTRRKKQAKCSNCACEEGS